MLTKIMPELPLDDVPAGIANYRDVLGFQINDLLALWCRPA